MPLIPIGDRYQALFSDALSLILSFRTLDTEIHRLWTERQSHHTIFPSYRH